MSSIPAAPPLYALFLDVAADCATALELCLNGGFLGVGWGVGAGPLDWPGYEHRAIERHGFVHGAVRELHDLPEGALIWTLDPAERSYYLAKVTGPWRYIHEGPAQSCGLHNVRSVQMVVCESTSQVPSAIVSCFVGEWVIQRIYDEHAARRSRSLFDELTADPAAARPTLDEVLTSYLDDRDVLNLVVAYLQNRLGYLVRPPIRRPGLPAWEYILRDGYRREAVVRARRGFAQVPRDAASLPSDAIEQIFVFSPTGTYGPDPAPNVTELDYDDLIDFMRNERWSLPPTVEHWASRALDEFPLRTD
jgi:hypothetical protein